MSESSPRTAVVLLAAGEGRRVGAGTNKVLLLLAGSPVFSWSVRVAQSLPYVERVVVVARPEDHDVVTAILDERLGEAEVTVVSGGESRHASEWNALSTLAPEIEAGRVDVVAIHDTARPLAPAALFDAVTREAAAHGGALPGREQRALLRRVAPAGGGPVEDPATELVAVQTPQAFRARPLLEAYRAANREGFVGTDTASCVERYTDLRVVRVPSPATNLKITFPEDLALAEHLLATLDRRRQPDAP